MESLKNSFIPGQLLDGRFRTVAPLNHGSFGMVFLATDIHTGQDVAIKCMMKSSPNESWNPSLSGKFEELDCHQRLAYHPNIVNLVHHFETANHLYLVLEYCANGDLYEAIRLNRGPLETEHVRDFMLQLVSAVEFMHANRLYHRDIKPENIFLMQDGSMKLGDLGLATRDAWCYEACVGSDRYMAPEQYDPANNGYSPAKADIWAIGICLLNVLFARNPFATPTESDILFADYVRDRQSLFDIFPNMSQDTFEILRIAMAVDPEKRSLAGLRDAILRAVTFTTDDEVLDEFCTDEREVVPASANREPLRTPSIQSPHINQGDSFPWAKALQSSPPQAIRQLSAIPDESYSEDLFPPSETAGTSWFSVHQTPSMASVLESALGDSYRSVAFAKTAPRYPPPSDPVTITGSLPSQAPKPIPSLSMVFGRDNKADQISKSWSDLWDEEAESEGEDVVLQQRREKNSRSWSHESMTARPDKLVTPGLREARSISILNAQLEPASSPEVSPRSSFEKPTARPVAVAAPKATHRSSRTLPKKSSFDKWAALGDKRRNFKPSDPSLESKRFPSNMTWRKDWGLGSSGFDYGQWAKKESLAQDRRRRPFFQKEWRRDSLETQRPVNIKPTVNNDYHGSLDEDLDLVGGWHDLHL